MLLLSLCLCEENNWYFRFCSYWLKINLACIHHSFSMLAVLDTIIIYFIDENSISVLQYFLIEIVFTTNTECLWHYDFLSLSLSLSMCVCLCLKSDAGEKQQSIHWIRSIYFILVFILYCLCMHREYSLPRLLMAHTNWNTFGGAFFFIILPHGNCYSYSHGQQSKIAANNCQWNVKHLTLSFRSTEFVVCMAVENKYVHLLRLLQLYQFYNVCRVSF